LNWKEKIPLEERDCMILWRIDETGITIDILGRPVPRPGNWGIGGRHLPKARWEGAQYKMVFHLRDSRGGSSH
jgi:hypothetical protein